MGFSFWILYEVFMMSLGVYSPNVAQGEEYVGVEHLLECLGISALLLPRI